MFSSSCRFPLLLCFLHLQLFLSPSSPSSSSSPARHCLLQATSPSLASPLLPLVRQPAPSPSSSPLVVPLPFHELPTYLPLRMFFSFIPCSLSSSSSWNAKRKTSSSNTIFLSQCSPRAVGFLFSFVFSAYNSSSPRCPPPPHHLLPVISSLLQATSPSLASPLLPLVRQRTPPPSSSPLVVSLPVRELPTYLPLPITPQLKKPMLHLPCATPSYQPPLLIIPPPPLVCPLHQLPPSPSSSAPVMPLTCHQSAVHLSLPINPPPSKFDNNLCINLPHTTSLVHQPPLPVAPPLLSAYANCPLHQCHLLQPPPSPFINGQPTSPNHPCQPRPLPPPHLTNI